MTTFNAEKFIDYIENATRLLKKEFSKEDFLTYYKDKIETPDALENYLTEEVVFNAEVIYNSKAMEFLTEYDPSLLKSIGLSFEAGLVIDDLNSEVLATLLCRDMLRDEVCRIDFEEFFEEEDDDVDGTE